jgi:hypothetical protein
VFARLPDLLCAESVLDRLEAATFSGGWRWQRGLERCSSEVRGGLALCIWRYIPLIA